MTRCSAQLLASSVLATLAGRAAGYWESGDTAGDPYTQAMLMSRRAANDPSALKQDPDLFKKMFGQLAIEQNQAKLMDEHQSTATAADRCMVCHGVILEIEKMFEERKHEATGGLGRRDQLAVTEVLEKVCHLNRYEFQDPVDLRKRTETSRLYGGIAPVLFANACKKVVDHWQDDDDEIERALLDGGSPDELHRELRERVCHRSGGICHGLGVEVEPRGDGGLREKGKEHVNSASLP